MNAKARLVRILLRMYPSAWLREYGDELEGMLLAEAFSLAVLLDAVLAAARQRVRYGDVRINFGLPLLLWALFWTAWNSVAPLSPSNYLLFNRFQWSVLLLAYFATGYGTRRRQNSSIWRSTLAAVSVALIGIAPELTLLILHAFGLIPLVLGNTDGQLQGRGIALLYTRGIGRVLRSDINFELVLLLVAYAIIAGISGLFGACLARVTFKSVKS
jgi:hypothetical protein